MVFSLTCYNRWPGYLVIIILSLGSIAVLGVPDTVSEQPEHNKCQHGLTLYTGKPISLKGRVSAAYAVARHPLYDSYAPLEAGTKEHIRARHVHVCLNDKLSPTVLERESLVSKARGDVWSALQRGPEIDLHTMENHPGNCRQAERIQQMRMAIQTAMARQRVEALEKGLNIFHEMDEDNSRRT